MATLLAGAPAALDGAVDGIGGLLRLVCRLVCRLLRLRCDPLEVLPHHLGHFGRRCRHIELRRRMRRPSRAATLIGGRCRVGPIHQAAHRPRQRAHIVAKLLGPLAIPQHACHQQQQQQQRDHPTAAAAIILARLVHAPSRPRQRWRCGVGALRLGRWLAPSMSGAPHAGRARRARRGWWRWWGRWGGRRWRLPGRRGRGRLDPSAGALPVVAVHAGCQVGARLAGVLRLLCIRAAHGEGLAGASEAAVGWLEAAHLVGASSVRRGARERSGWRRWWARRRRWRGRQRGRRRRWLHPISRTEPAAPGGAVFARVAADGILPPALLLHAVRAPHAAALLEARLVLLRARRERWRRRREWRRLRWRLVVQEGNPVVRAGPVVARDARRRHRPAH